MTVVVTAETFERAVGRPLDEYAHRCHAASIQLVKSGIFGSSCRVARGFCPGVPGQHSWVVVGDDCYDKTATVVDATLWSYDETVDDVWVGLASERPHQPHGTGNIFAWGKPVHRGGETIKLTAELSPAATKFLGMVGPLDYEGWRTLSNAPVEGWPAAEIMAAIYDDARLTDPPIDIVGMLTDRLPNLYLPDRKRAAGGGRSGRSAAAQSAPPTKGETPV